MYLLARQVRATVDDPFGLYDVVRVLVLYERSGPRPVSECDSIPASQTVPEMWGMYATGGHLFWWYLF